MIKVQKENSDNNISRDRHAEEQDSVKYSSKPASDSQANLDRLSGLLAQLNNGELTEENNEPEHSLGEIQEELVKLNENENEPEPETESVRTRVPLKGLRKNHDGKSGESKGPSKKAIILAIIGVLVVCIAAGIIAYHNLTTYRFNEDATYYVMNMGYDIPKGSTARINNDGEVIVQRKNNIDLPAEYVGIYFNDSQKLLTVVPMSYFRANYRDDRWDKLVLPLTEIGIDSGKTFMQRNGKFLSQNGAFLYDGNDTYILLTEAELFIGDELVRTLSPLSSVFCNYSNFVEYRDYNSGEYETISLDPDEYKEVILNFPKEGIRLTCDRDLITVGDETEMLTSAVTTLNDALE